MRRLSNTLVLLFLTVFLSGQTRTISNSDSVSYKQALNLLRQSLHYIAVHQTDSIPSCFDQALAYSIEHGFEDLLPIIYIEKAQLAGRQDNDLDRALQLLGKARPFIEKNNLHPYAEDYYASLAQLYFAQKKYQTALDYLGKTEQVRNRTAPFRNWKTYNFYARIYRNMGRTKLAEKYSREGEKLGRLQNVTKTINEMENDFLIGEKNEKIEELVLQNHIIQLEKNIARKESRYFLMGLIMALGLLFLMGLFLYQRSRNNRILLEKNEIIAQNLSEKEVLFKEIHHRVKNNLQLISSLLSLQSRSVDDEKAFEALSESQNRVISMALIHQNLYKDNVHSFVDVKDYITQLTDRLIMVYQGTPEKIKLEIAVDPIQLDVATLVPLGLIINELVTNAFKHGFDKQREGVLHISLVEKANTLLLKVIDNGKEGIYQKQEKGFGMRLVDTLAAKLEGEMLVYYEHGTCVEVSMKNYKPLSTKFL